MEYLLSKENITIDGVTVLNSLSSLEENVSGTTIYIHLDSLISTTQDDFKCLSVIGNLLRNNSVYLLLDSLDVTKDTLKVMVISNFVMYNNYNIYLLENQEIDKQLLQNINENEVTRVDLKMFFSKSVDSLVHLKDSLNEITSLSEEEKEISINHLNNVLALHKLDVVGEYQKEINNLNSKMSDLNTKLDKAKSSVNVGFNSSLSLKEYTTLNTQNYSTNIQGILYLKEYSPVSYINTVIKYYLIWLNSKGVKTKLIIFDDLNDLNVVYSGFEFATPETIPKGSSNFVGNKTVVVTERNTAILDTILKDASLKGYTVIILDKLHSVKDMVTGYQVAKYGLFRSESSYKKIVERYNSTLNLSENIISNSRINPNGVVLETIKDFNNGSDSIKLSRYLKLVTGNGTFLYDRFSKELGLHNCLLEGSR